MRTPWFTFLCVIIISFKNKSPWGLAVHLSTGVAKGWGQQGGHGHVVSSLALSIKKNLQKVELMLIWLPSPNAHSNPNTMVSWHVALPTGNFFFFENATGSPKKCKSKTWNKNRWSYSRQNMKHTLCDLMLITKRAWIFKRIENRPWFFSGQPE